MRAVRLLGVAACVIVTGCVTSATPSGSPSTPSVFVGTRTEYMQAVVQCLVKKGVSARFEVAEDGTPRVAMPATTKAQIDRNNAAQEECRKELPPTPDPTTDADFREFYAHLNAEAACVRQEGYETAPAPSFQKFLESARGTGIDWDPFRDVPPQLVDSVRAKCQTDPNKWW